jgi:hypothetical protein
MNFIFNLLHRNNSHNYSTSNWFCPALQVRIICASDSDTEMSVVALVLGRAIALAPSLAFLIMLCVQDVAPAGVTVYSPGQLLAPVYLWGAAVALSLLGQSFEYSEDVSTVSKAWPPHVCWDLVALRCRY